ncbi:MAG TPA: hypothetical protein VGN26_09450 [Armatimonadota bacterium]|jgi:hypothetical protein
MSGSLRGVIEIEALKHSEEIYRARLANEPGDTTARMKLAWCLFMQALYRAGQESVLMALVAASGAREDSPEGALLKALQSEESSALFGECLKQTNTVLQLSPSDGDRRDMERLQYLARLSGAGQAVVEAEEAAARILGELLRELQ